MRRKLMRARYRARFDKIATRYAAFKIEGPPEVREAPSDPLNAMFTTQIEMSKPQLRPKQWED